MKIFQTLIFLGVMSSLIYGRSPEELSGSGPAFGLLSLMATLLATGTVIEIGDRWARLTGRAPPLTPQQRRDARQSPLRPRRLDADRERQ
jgi:hypothetical protein